MISPSERRNCVELITTARDSGARLSMACEVVGIRERTFQRWTESGSVGQDRRPTAARPEPANKLTADERQAILDVCHQADFASLPPSQIVPRLADEGRYIASESSFYRVLREAGEQNHRGRARTPRNGGPPRSHLATRPNEVWSWDITWLKGPIAGMFFYLYLILDVYSRKIVGWEVHDIENTEKSSKLIHKAILREGATGLLRVLHADNGSAQKGSTLLAKLEALGVAASFSRPRVSDDNAHAEAVFRTCKYRPGYPKRGFKDIANARQWVLEFVRWYNDEHFHSGICFVTPNARHEGQDESILSGRSEVYEQARNAHPERWSRHTRNWSSPKEVWLNKPKDAMHELEVRRERGDSKAA